LENPKRKLWAFKLETQIKDFATICEELETRPPTTRKNKRETISSVEKRY